MIERALLAVLLLAAPCRAAASGAIPHSVRGFLRSVPASLRPAVLAYMNSSEPNRGALSVLLRDVDETVPVVSEEAAAAFIERARLSQDSALSLAQLDGRFADVYAALALQLPVDRRFGLDVSYRVLKRTFYEARRAKLNELVEGAGWGKAEVGAGEPTPSLSRSDFVSPEAAADAAAAEESLTTLLSRSRRKRQLQAAKALLGVQLRHPEVLRDGGWPTGHAMLQDVGRKYELGVLAEAKSPLDGAALISRHYSEARLGSFVTRLDVESLISVSEVALDALLDSRRVDGVPKATERQRKIKAALYLVAIDAAFPGLLQGGYRFEDWPQYARVVRLFEQLQKRRLTNG